MMPRDSQGALFSQAAYLCLILFSGALGLLLVSLLIPLYFGTFGPIPTSLTGYFLVIGFIIAALGFAVAILFRRGRKGIASSILVTSIFLFGFGAPIFLVENNHILSDRVADEGEVPSDDLVRFSEAEISVLKFMYGLYAALWGRVHLWATLYVFCYLMFSVYLWRRRIREKSEG